MRAPGRTAASLIELSELMEALAAKNGTQARVLAERHVRNAAKTAIALLASQAEIPPPTAKPQRNQKSSPKPLRAQTL